MVATASPAEVTDSAPLARMDEPLPRFVGLAMRDQLRRVRAVQGALGTGGAAVAFVLNRPAWKRLRYEVEPLRLHLDLHPPVTFEGVRVMVDELAVQPIELLWAQLA